LNPSADFATERIRFDMFEADLRTGELWRSGRKLRIPNQSFRVLTLLVERAGQLVTREELRANLWPTGTYVEYDQSLNAAVNRLREVLRDSADKPRFIETLPRRGYRFIGAILRDPPAREGLQSARPDTIAPIPIDSAVAGRRTALPVAAGALIAMLVIAGVIFALVRHPTSEPPAPRAVVPFTSLPGQEEAPTFSPDGSHIAFAWNGETGSDTQFDLYVKEIGSERLLRLTHHPSRQLIPAWSPDGSSIAFVRVTEAESAIYSIPALGGPERRLVPDRVGVRPLIRISWSSDGKWLAYPAYGRRGAQEIYLLSLETLQTQRLTPAPDCADALEPAFSPDGKQLALVCTSSHRVYALHVVGMLDGTMRPLASMMGDPQGLAWSADAGRILFANDAGRGGELWELTLAGRLSQLPFGESGSAPAVAARGAHIAYVRGRNITDVWRFDLTAAHPEGSAKKLIYSTRAQGNPRYSQDGTHIAFQSNRSGSTEIWLTDGAGADPVRLTAFNGPFTDEPSWCSDGRRIAFDSSASGIPAVYVEDITERLPRKITTSRTDLTRPAWSQDCRWLFASDGKFRLYRFPASGGPAELFTNRPAYYPMAVGDRIIFGVTEPTGVVLWSKPSSGGAESPVANLPRLSYGDAWAANSTGLYYTDSSSGQPAVNFHDFATGATHRILTLEKGPVPTAGYGIAVSADGRYLLNTQVDELQTEIMLGPIS
jgi:Tol biopolymer transport system component/DNA-binding winged helix-turn-helix (wHTH) protein